MTVNMNSIRPSVVEYCAEIGADSMLVQGAGGNVSWKEGDTLWIKASGTWLADAKEKDIFVPVDLEYLRLAMDTGNFAVTTKLKSNSPLRPSIETMLHALMPHRLVVHVHAIDALAYLVREQAETQMRARLNSLFEYAMVSYQKPGEALAKAVAEALVRSPNANVVFLKNHGVVIGGDSVAEVEATLNLLTSTLTTQPILFSESQHIPSEINLGNGLQYAPVGIADIHNLAQDTALFVRIKTGWALYPDHVVFLGHQAVCFESLEQIEKQLRTESVSDLIFVKGMGVFAKGQLSSAKQAQLKCYYDVIVRQPKQGVLRPLNEQQIAHLLDWDAERYRQQIAK